MNSLLIYSVDSGRKSNGVSKIGVSFARVNISVTKPRQTYVESKIVFFVTLIWALINHTDPCNFAKSCDWENY